jgi:hypothetical protein
MSRCCAVRQEWAGLTIARPNREGDRCVVRGRCSQVVFEHLPSRDTCQSPRARRERDYNTGSGHGVLDVSRSPDRRAWPRRKSTPGAEAPGVLVVIQCAVGATSLSRSSASTTDTWVPSLRSPHIATGDRREGLHAADVAHADRGLGAQLACRSDGGNSQPGKRGPSDAPKSPLPRVLAVHERHARPTCDVADSAERRQSFRSPPLPPRDPFAHAGRPLALAAPGDRLGKVVNQRHVDVVVWRWPWPSRLHLRDGPSNQDGVCSPERAPSVTSCSNRPRYAITARRRSSVVASPVVDFV